MKIRRLGQSFILGIETSCDETAAAVVDDAGAVRSSVVASQFDVHARYGGVVPELASREHLRAIVPVVRAALDQAETSLSGLDAVAVTAGPGLVGSLLVGATYAKALAFAVQLPLVAVNHVEGHIFSVLLDHPEVAFPAVALVVSGGHTHLFYVGAPGEYRLLGRTRDDAAGEAYDKVAKLLGFGYPGGPLIDQLAPYGRVGTVRFTPARMKGNELDFSFSGLKTAVLRWTEAQPGMAEEIARRSRWTDRSLPGWLEVTPKRTLDMLAAFQHTVVEELLTRVRRATDETGADSVVVAGGVAANAGLRQRAVELFHGHCCFPTRALSTDNAAMIAAAAWPKLRRGDLATYKLKVQANLAIA